MLYQTKHYAVMGIHINCITQYQTLTYYGVDRNILENFIIENSVSGIDRIVPVGRALDMDLVWDGYDVISYLSRIVDIK